MLCLTCIFYFLMFLIVEKLFFDIKIIQFLEGLKNFFISEKLHPRISCQKAQNFRWYIFNRQRTDKSENLLIRGLNQIE